MYNEEAALKLENSADLTGGGRLTDMTADDMVGVGEECTEKWRQCE